MDKAGTTGASATRAHAPVSRRERTFLWLHRNLDRWGTPLALWVYRRTRGGIAHRAKVDVLLLTTRGRRTGRERSVMLQYFPDGDAMLVTAANGGGEALPGWYHNLTAAPAARVEIDDRVIPVRADELGADEAEAWWTRIVQRAPSYALYRRATDRPFPVVRLVPSRGAHPGGGPTPSAVHSGVRHGGDGARERFPSGAGRR
jgi:deazaflavin-dependent oxidoreductase (nitroreductase family)